ncbi:hypothetical protein BDV11DRAFT_169664 [Aspergillus similis]
MTAPPRPSSRADFRIAILCPHLRDAEVVKPLFDHLYDIAYHAELIKVPTDPNLYTLGRIGVYDTVLVHIPGAGKVIAANATAHIKLSYPKIELAFLIGACQGVPFIADCQSERGRTDIYLGDVIIGTGVVQYDLGKHKPRGLVRKDTFEANLGRPSQEIRSLLSKIMAWKDELRYRQRKYLATIQESVEAPCPGANRDILYSQDYKHALKICQCTSGQCTHEPLVARRREFAASPVVHFGLLASGDRHMTSSKLRDNIARREGVLGFETEGAGVWDNLPCILVKGVVDYADGHESKDWQCFAAANAAACMRAILDEAPVFVSPPVAGICQGEQLPFLTNMRNKPEDIDQASKAREDAYIRLLRFPRADFRLNEIPEAHRETCTWVETWPEYQSWVNDDNPGLQRGIFWIKGKPGSGKSTLMKHVLKGLRAGRTDCIVLSFFFYSQGVELERSAIGMYRSLLHQLLTSNAATEDTKRLYFDIAAEAQSSEGKLEWRIRDLKGLLLSAVRSLRDRHVFLMVDAIDECEQDEVGDILSFLQHMVSSAATSGVHLKICLASRHYPKLTIGHAVELVLEHQPDHQSDIKKYVEATIAGGRSRIAKDVQDEICAKTSGVFLWVHRVVPSLNEAFQMGNMRKVQQQLDETPDDLGRVFTQILTTDAEDIDDLIFCLQLVLLSPRPLSREELYFAISFANCGLVRRDVDLQTDTAIDKYIVNISKGLIEIIQSKAKFIHESLRDFLLRRNGFSTLRAELRENTVGRSHERIARVCLNYVCDVSRNKAYWEVVRELADLPQHRQSEFIRRHIPFLGYACSNFLYHFRAAQAADVLGAPLVDFTKVLQSMSVRAIEKDGLHALDRAHDKGMAMNLLLTNALSNIHGETEEGGKTDHLAAKAKNEAPFERLILAGYGAACCDEDDRKPS